MGLTPMLLFFGPFELLGVILLVYGLRQRQLAQAASTWPCAPGHSVAASVQTVTRHSKYGTSRSYVPRLEYDYDVKGAHLTSHRITFGSVSFNSPDEAEAYMRRNFQDKPLEVHYDPRNPANAVLLVGQAPSSLGFMIGGVIIMAAPILLAAFSLWPR